MRNLSRWTPLTNTAKYLTGREVPDSEPLPILHPSPPQRGRDHSNTLRLGIYREWVHREGFKPYSIVFYFISISISSCWRGWPAPELQARYIQCEHQGSSLTCSLPTPLPWKGLSHLINQQPLPRKDLIHHSLGI